jgi:hypothetical protein
MVLCSIPRSSDGLDIPHAMINKEINTSQIALGFCAGFIIHLADVVFEMISTDNAFYRLNNYLDLSHLSLGQEMLAVE